MVSYTTPQITLLIEGIDLTGQDKDIYVSIGNKCLVTKSGEDVSAVLSGEDTLVYVRLTQEESARLLGLCKVQVNWINDQGIREATEIETIEVTPNMLQEVIRYGE